MHDLAVFSLQAQLESKPAAVRLAEIDSQVDAWLEGKGATAVKDSTGCFKSQSGEGDGKFTRRLIETTVGSLRETQLVETTAHGHIFTTTIYAAYDAVSVIVFGTLSVTSEANVVAPVQTYPRCPKVIRGLIESFSDWTFGTRPVPPPTPLEAVDEPSAMALCQLLRDPARNLPAVVVSIDPDEEIWPAVAYELARDLVGIAHVAVVSEEGSWVLTDELGKQNSCYLGAVRLYWPTSHQSTSTLKGTVWTTSHLIDDFGVGVTGMRRFLSQMRQTAMSTAALTIAQPKIIREVHNAATLERLRALEAVVRDKELESIVLENSQLTADLNQAEQEIAALQRKLASLRSKGDEGDNVDDGQASTAPVHLPPAIGELRYYKKIGKKGDADVLVVTKACNHSSKAWRPAFKAIQAEKGLQLLEGRSDWKSYQHCGSCTGGGRWRVQW